MRRLAFTSAKRFGLSPARFALSLAAWIQASACAVEEIPFVCDADEQCALNDREGFCLDSGFCAYEDAQCPSRLKYGAYASEELRRQCVASCVNSISLGGKHTCVTLEDGNIRCFGDDREGQSSGKVSAKENALDPVQLKLPGPLSFTSDSAGPVSSGASENCTIVDDGELFCWGGLYQESSVQAELSMLDSAAFQVAVGKSLTCVRLRGGVGCWDPNAPGSGTLLKFQVDVLEIAVGGSHGCALVSGGLLMCFGDNAQAQRTLPLVATEGGPNVLDLEQVSQLSLGDEHSCAVADGNVYCWGANDYAQSGRAASTDPEPRPSRVPIPGEATQVAAGSRHTCALNERGQIFCWGDNEFGQLGPGAHSGAATLGGARSGQALPAEVPLAEPARSVAAGGSHSCAIGAGGRVYCWGNNDRGQLGTGGRSPVEPPTAVRTSALSCE